MRARTRHHIQVYFTNLERMADTPVFERGAIGFDLEGYVERRHSYHLTLHLLLPATWQPLRVSDGLSSKVAGVRTMLALERCRARHAAYPASLEQLVPDFLVDVPIDTHSGRPPVYRRIDDIRYTLYSVALDGRDDGGKAYSWQPEHAQTSRSAAGYDYVFRDDAAKK